MDDEISLITAGTRREDAESAFLQGYQQRVGWLKEIAQQRGLKFTPPDHEAVERNLRANLAIELPHFDDDPDAPVLTRDFDFSQPPAFDHDDAATYCLDLQGNRSHKGLLVRWLSHQWSVRHVPAARAALRRAFCPLAAALERRYRVALARSFGSSSTSRWMASQLDAALGDFDFFAKTYEPMGDEKMDLAHLGLDRSRGRLTSTFELPIESFLRARLTLRIREELKSQGAERLPGPFEIPGSPGRYLLLEDVVLALGRSPSQVRRWVGAGVLKAWKLPGLRKHLGLPACASIVLRNPSGRELVLATATYWIFDLDSVVALRGRGDRSRRYVLGRIGRPPKGATAGGAPDGGGPHPAGQARIIPD